MLQVCEKRAIPGESIDDDSIYLWNTSEANLYENIVNVISDTRIMRFEAVYCYETLQFINLHKIARQKFGVLNADKYSARMLRTMQQITKIRV